MAAAVNVTSSQFTRIKLSRQELMAWVNETLEAELHSVEQMCTGAAYCQLMEILFPGSVPLQKVFFHTKVEYEFFHNFKLLQAAFEKHRVTKEIPINLIITGRRSDNLDFLQWFKRFFDANYEKHDYNARAARDGVPLAFGTPNGARSRSLSVTRTSGRSKRYPSPIRYASESTAAVPTPLRWAAASRASGAFSVTGARPPPAVSRDTQTSARAPETETRDTQTSPRDNISWALQSPSNRKSREENRELGGMEGSRQGGEHKSHVPLSFGNTDAKEVDDPYDADASAGETERYESHRRPRLSSIRPSLKSRASVSPHPTLTRSIPSYINNDPMVDAGRKSTFSERLTDASFTERELMSKAECLKHCRRAAAKGAGQSDTEDTEDLGALMTTKTSCARFCKLPPVPADTTDEDHPDGAYNYSEDGKTVVTTKESCAAFCKSHAEHIDDTDNERVNTDELSLDLGYEDDVDGEEGEEGDGVAEEAEEADVGQGEGGGEYNGEWTDSSAVTERSANEIYEELQKEEALVAALVREKEYYYNKLLKIESLVTDTDSDNPTERVVIEKVTEILYKLEDGFMPPPGNDEDEESAF